MRNPTLSTGALTGFLLGIALLLGIGAVSVRSASIQEETRLWVDHTHEVRLALDQLLRSVVESQNSRRGYVITNDERFLRSFGEGLTRIETTYRSLRVLTRDNPRQQQRILAVRPLLDRQMDNLRRSVEWARGPESRADDQKGITASSRTLFEELSQRVAEMSAEEATLLAGRESLARQSASRSRWVTIAGTLTAILLLMAVLTQVVRETVARRRSEARAVASEARFSGILDIAADAIISFDESLKIVLFNQGAETIFGYTAKEVLGSSLDLLIPARYRSGQEALAMPFDAVQREIFGLRRNGTEFPAEVSVSRLDLDSEKVFTVILRDVTERKRLEEERDRYFSTSADLMCVAGANGYFKRLNPAWENALGWTREELMSRPFLDFVHPLDRPSTDAATALSAESQPVAGFRNRYRCKDGSYRWLSWTSPGVAPGSTDIYGSARDVTDEIQAAHRISALNATLETRAAQLTASNKELEAFCYSISHDLRAPLRAISGFSQILEEECQGSIDAEGRRLLGLIRANTGRMGQLIDDLLTFSRMGRQAMRCAPVEMQEIVESVARELTQSAAPRRIVVTIGALPHAIGDHAMLRQVWVNLLSNAIKYTRNRDQARIDVSGRIEGDEAVYAVRDNGVGIDMQYAHKLFGVFQRLHSAAEFEGTGVGLALAQRILERHHGRIWVDGQAGEGATFTFALPLNDRNTHASAPSTEPREEATHAR